MVGKQSLVLPDGSALDVSIPAGHAGTVRFLRLKGKGRPGVGDGPPGDALIEISVLPHPYFTRKGDDIYLDLPISLKGGGAGRQDQGADPERNGHGGGAEMVEYRASSPAEGPRRARAPDGSKGDQYVTLKLGASAKA